MIQPREIVIVPVLRSITLFDYVLADGLQKGFRGCYGAFRIGRPSVKGLLPCPVDAGLVKRCDRLRNELVRRMAPRRRGRLDAIDWVTRYPAAFREGETVSAQKRVELLKDWNMFVLVPV